MIPLIPILALLDGVPHLTATSVLSWSALERRGFRSEEEELRIAQQELANILGRDFARHALEHAKLMKAHEPTGLRLTLHGYCLTHGDIVDLLGKAFEKGQKDAMTRTPTICL
jgi:hypothetical protein